MTAALAAVTSAATAGAGCRPGCAGQVRGGRPQTPVVLAAVPEAGYA